MVDGIRCNCFDGIGFSEPFFFAIFQRRNVHYHVDFFCSHIKNHICLLFFHGGSLVSIRKTDNCPSKDPRSL